jgi:acyl carrier protein
MRAWIAAACLAFGLAQAPAAFAAPLMPYAQILYTVRDLAAAQLGRRSAEIDTAQSLFAQGLTENGLAELVSAMEVEFGIVIPEHEIHQGKWNDPVRAFSVRRLADLVAARLQQQPE